MNDIKEVLGLRDEEPLIEPAVARHWLVEQTGRAVEQEDGTVSLKPKETPDHLGHAAMAIARGSEPRYFSELYAEVTSSRAPLAPWFIKSVAQGMVRVYLAQMEQGL